VIANLNEIAVINTTDFESAHGAMINAAKGAGYTIQAVDGDPLEFDVSYRLSGSGPQNGAILRLHRGHVAASCAIEVFQKPEVAPKDVPQAVDTMGRFINNVEDAVCHAVGLEPKRAPRPRHHRTTVEMADGTDVADVSHTDPIGEALTVDEQVAGRLADARDGTTVITRRISGEGVESTTRQIKMGSSVIVQGPDGKWGSRTLHSVDGRPKMTPPKPTTPPPFAMNPRAVQQTSLGV